MKVQWNVSIGTVRGHRSSIVEIGVSDEDLEDMSGIERDDYIDRFVKEDFFNKVEFYWEILKEGEK